MRLSLITYALSASIVAAASGPQALSLRQTTDPNTADPATYQCLASCLQGVAASHQVEYENCTEQTIDAQQACVCKTDYFKENLKCISKCYKADAVDDALAAAAAACERFATGDGITSGSGDKATDTDTKDDPDSKGEASFVRTSPKAVVLAAIASFVALL